MRLNAPIPALVAVAVLCLSPAGSFATPMHHVAHAATAAGAKHSAHANAAAEAAHVRGSKHHGTAKAAPVTTVRVHAHAAAKRRHLRQAVSSPAPEVTRPELTAAETAPRKATSEDFLRAAAAQSEMQPAMAVQGTSHPDELNEAGPAEHAPTRKPVSETRPVSVANPVPVVSVIRPAAERPQLESVEEVASTPVILPTLYNKRGHLIMPPPLKGSHEILIHQNEVADRDGLARVQNDDDLLDMRRRKMLVGLPVDGTLQVDDRLPVNRRFCRPWTAQFLATLARAHYVQFHTPLQVNSAVRTVEFQQHLIHINGNAAPAEGDTASPHLTGQAVDIAKHGLSLAEIAWMRGYLLPLVQEGKIDVEEEFQQSCFHISVYKKYVPTAESPERELAVARHGGTSALAAALR